MTVFEYLTFMDIDGFAKWLDEHGMFDGSPWLTWFDNEHCKKCEPEISRIPNINGEREVEYGYCELHGKYRYFEDKDKTPDNRDIIRMWLEQEI